ncbi:flagellar biosynthetic protein FliR [Bacillaceae bacterium S4-13-56]
MIDMININTFPAFLLIFVRIMAFFTTLPIFSYRNLPTHYKIGMAFFLAWIIFYTIDVPMIIVNETFILLIIKEALIGLLIGLIAYIILSAIQIAGGFIDFQMGFAIANVIDPQTGAQSPLIGQYLYIFALLFLLAVDGHHLLIEGIYYSFQWIPMQKFITFSDGSIASFVIQSFNQMFIIAFQMSIPIVGSLFLVDVALGIIARTVPQLNVFVVGIPLKILVSFFVIFISLSLYTILVRNLFDTVLYSMRGLIQIMGGT